MKEIIFLENELWWSGIVCDGINMPYDKNTSFIIDLCSHKTNNQVNPVLISNKGRPAMKSQEKNKIKQDG